MNADGQVPKQSVGETSSSSQETQASRSREHEGSQVADADKQQPNMQTGGREAGLARRDLVGRTRQPSSRPTTGSKDRPKLIRGQADAERECR